MSVVRCRVIVSGRVQGVFFRDSCRSTARGFGIRGWVRNRSEGTLELVAEGPRERVDQFLDWCRQGPPRAQVTGIVVTDEVPAAERGFRVVY